MAEPPPDIEALSLDDLKGLGLQFLEEIAALKSDLKAYRERPTRRRRREPIRPFDHIFTARTGVAPRRRISAGTRSAAGREARDAVLGLMKACAEQGIPFWDDLGDRLGVPGTPPIPDLRDLVRRHVAPA